MKVVTCAGWRCGVASETKTMVRNASGTVHSAGWASSCPAQVSPRVARNVHATAKPEVAPPTISPANAPESVSRGHQIPRISSGQKDAITPGQNEKRYLAGALDVRSGQVHWVEAEQKNSWLFWDLLYKLTRVYAEAKIIHVILDNYGIHSSKIIAVALANFASRIRLHFLPPFSPDDNAIERIWQDLHANVTRNHRCASMAELLGEVRYYLRKRNRRTLRQTATATAA